jgi:hypothetical protein
MSTLTVVEEILRERKQPMVVREIVVAAGERLPTKSRTPDTVVARDLAMDIKKHPESTLFARVAPGKYTLREYAHAFTAPAQPTATTAPAVTPASSPVPAAASQPAPLHPVTSNSPLARASSAPPVQAIPQSHAGPMARREGSYSA